MNTHTTLPADTLATLVEEQAALRAEVLDLREQVARLAPKPRKPTPADVVLHRLLRDWVQPFGRDFLAAEVEEALDVDGALRTAVVDVIGDQRKGRARRLGKWLQRMEGVEIDGLRIVRQGDLHGSARWRFDLGQGQA